MEEIWKVVDDYPDYKISNMGNIKSCKYNKEKLLSPTQNKYGYLRVGLHQNNKTKQFSVHRLVAIAFIPNPENLSTVDHIDQNKTNNYLSNLRWASYKTQNDNRSNTRTDILETDPIERQRISSKESAQIRIDEKRFYCNTCNLAFHNQHGLERHLNSTSHLRILNFKPTTAHFCRPCGVSCKDKYVLESHNKSKRHKRIMENK